MRLPVEQEIIKGMHTIIIRVFFMSATKFMDSITLLISHYVLTMQNYTNFPTWQKNLPRTNWHKKTSLFWGGLGTAYESRTRDLLRERQMSWTTRRMRHLWCRRCCAAGDFSFEIGCKSTNIFQYGQIFLKKTLHHTGYEYNIFFQPQDFFPQMATPYPSANKF